MDRPGARQVPEGSREQQQQRQKRRRKLVVKSSVVPQQGIGEGEEVEVCCLEGMLTRCGSVTYLSLSSVTYLNSGWFPAWSCWMRTGIHYPARNVPQCQTWRAAQGAELRETLWHCRQGQEKTRWLEKTRLRLSEWDRDLDSMIKESVC